MRIEQYIAACSESNVVPPSKKEIEAGQDEFIRVVEKAGKESVAQAKA
jgi:hypothetical protein